MVTAQNISYKAGARYLLEDVSLRFDTGRLNLIVGANGAGKSTLIKILSGQLTPHKGEVYYGTSAIRDVDLRALAKIRGVLSQTLEVTFPVKVWEVVMMGRYPHITGAHEEKDERAIEESMKFFDVSEWADRDYTTLSGGEKQRVHFARVMAQVWYPVEGLGRYLYLDEPLTFLDIYYQFRLMGQLSDLLRSQDFTIIGVVHDLNLAARFADSITVLSNGKLLATGSPSEVLTPDIIFNAFGLKPKVSMLNGKPYIQF